MKFGAGLSFDQQRARRARQSQRKAKGASFSTKHRIWIRKLIEALAMMLGSSYPFPMAIERINGVEGPLGPSQSKAHLVLITGY